MSATNGHSNGNGHAIPWQVEQLQFTPRQVALNLQSARYSRQAAYLELVLTAADEPAAQAHVERVQTRVRAGTQERLAAARKRCLEASEAAGHCRRLEADLERFAGEARQAEARVPALKDLIVATLAAGGDPAQAEQQLRACRELADTYGNRAAALEQLAAAARKQVEAELQAAEEAERQAIAGEAAARREELLAELRGWFAEHLEDLQAAGGVLDALGNGRR